MGRGEKAPLLTAEDFDRVIQEITIPDNVVAACRAVWVDGMDRVKARRLKKCDDGVLIRSLRRVKDTHLRLKHTEDMI